MLPLTGHIFGSTSQLARRPLVGEVYMALQSITIIYVR